MAQPAVYHSEISMGMSRQANESAYQFDRNISRTPENIVTIFTVNTRDQFSATAGVRFPGRAANERYRKVATISDPKYYVDDLSIEGSSKKNILADDGKWVAMDWLNPNNVFTLDQNYTVQTSVDDGTDLLARGLFFIVRPYNPATGNVDDKPTEEEIVAAEKRLQNRYTMLVRQYHQVSTSSPASLPRIMNDEMVDALNFAGVSTPYNSTLQQKVSCPTCGDMKLASAKFHRSETLGIICIEPTAEGWKAAVMAGVKKSDEVPEEFREKRGPGRPALNKD